MKKSLQWSLVLSVIGWLDAFYALYHRQSLLARGLDEPSSCNLGGVVNCDAVALSSFGTWFGIPVAAFGLAFYVVLIALSLRALLLEMDDKKEPAGRIGHWLFALTVVGLFPTAWLAASSFFAIKAVCLMCLVTYVINVALLMSTWRLKGAPGELPMTPGFATMIAIVAGLQLVLPQLLESNLTNGRRIEPGVIATYLKRFKEAEVHDIHTEGFPTWGARNAPVTLVEFSDFQCPHCKRGAATLPAIASSYGGKVKIVFRNYPLNGSCNSTPGIGTSGHPFACPAAKAGRCVFKMKGDEAFFRYLDAVFAKQDDLSQEIIDAAATKEGISDADLKACVASSETHEALMNETAEGAALKIEGTPAIYLNGKFLDSGSSPRVLKALLDEVTR